MSYDPKSTHYDHGGIEVLDVIRAKLTPAQFEGWLLGNVIKYSTRANFKGDFGRDAEKCAFYAQKLAQNQSQKNAEPEVVELSGSAETTEDSDVH